MKIESNHPFKDRSLLYTESYLFTMRYNHGKDENTDLPKGATVISELLAPRKKTLLPLRITILSQLVAKVYFASG